VAGDRALAVATGHQRSVTRARRRMGTLCPGSFLAPVPNQGFWSPGKGRSPVPQAGLGPSAAACPSHLLGFSHAQTLEGQTDRTAKQQVSPSLSNEPSSLTPHVPTQLGTAATPPQTRCHLRQRLLSPRVSQGLETRPVWPGAPAVRNAQKPVRSWPPLPAPWLGARRDQPQSHLELFGGFFWVKKAEEGRSSF